MCQDSLVGLGAPELTSRSRRGSALLRRATEELRFGDAGDANRARDDSDLTVRRGVWNFFQYSDPIYLIRVHPGRPAALPTATGWDEELRAWRCTITAAGALRVIVLDGVIHMSGHAPPPVPIQNGVAGGSESVRAG